MTDYMTNILRGRSQKIKDFLFFPVRALTLFEENRWGLSSLRTERFDYVAAAVQGYCLDVGCGRNNIFVRNYLKGCGRGIDVFSYEGLTGEELVADITQFPFESESFDTVSFIASINHVPKEMRDRELAEAYRCLKQDGNIIITMGNPIAELVVHKWVHIYDKLFGTTYDMDGERGMEDGEDYYLRDGEIYNRLYQAGFVDLKKQYFWTQWGLNHMFIGWKK